MCKRHLQILNSYIDELREAKGYVEKWWTALIDSEERAVGNMSQAVQRVRVRWPQGPSTHPRIIAIVRKYYFDCVATNKDILDRRKIRGENPYEVQPHVLMSPEQRSYEQDEEEEQPVNPSVLLSEYLLNPETTDLAEFMADLTYWPIGMDQQGNLS